MDDNENTKGIRTPIIVATIGLVVIVLSTYFYNEAKMSSSGRTKYKQVEIAR